MPSKGYISEGYKGGATEVDPFRSGAPAAMQAPRIALNKRQAMQRDGENLCKVYGIKSLKDLGHRADVYFAALPGWVQARVMSRSTLQDQLAVQRALGVQKDNADRVFVFFVKCVEAAYEQGCSIEEYLTGGKEHES